MDQLYCMQVYAREVEHGFASGGAEGEVSFAGEPHEGVRRITEDAGMAVAPEVLEDPTAWAAEFEAVSASLKVPFYRTFWRVTLPNVKWALLYGVILCNARAMGEFGAVSVVSGRTECVELSLWHGVNLALALSLVVMYLIHVITRDEEALVSGDLRIDMKRREVTRAGTRSGSTPRAPSWC